jgi:hypothetical protein
MIEYITKDQDRWDLVAWQMYGDPYLYEPIVLANFEHAKKLIFMAGIKLKIPIVYIENENTEVSPPWQRD